MTDLSIKRAAAELAQVAGVETSLSGKFIFDKEQVVEEVPFTVCKIKGDFGFGFLLPKEVPIFSGKGKERKEVGKEQIRSPAVLTSNPKLIEPSPKTEDAYRVKFVAIPTVLKMRCDLKLIDDYRNRRAETPQGKEIFEAINSTYKKFLFFQNDLWYDVHTLWDIGTYFFILFNTYPIFELRGLSGTAKSKVMEVSRLHSLNPTEIMINPSEASLFRITHSNRPTKYIDEAEKLFQYISGTWQSSPVVELINGSYSRGSTVPRMEKVGNSYKMVYYFCYSPTMVGSIAGLRDATETRAITHIMTKAGDNDKRGELEVKDFENDQAYQINRNNLYLFALQNWQLIEQTYSELKIDTLKKRDFQLWRPLLSIAKVLDNDLFDKVLKFAERLSRQKKQDFISEGTIDFKVMNIVSQRLEINETKIYMKDIARILNEGSQDKTAEKTISAHLDKLGFKDFRDKDMNGSYLQIDKNIFDIIVSPICPSLSFYSSYSSYNKEKEEKKNDECMMNADEKEARA